MKLVESKKLFYDKYIYKLNVLNTLGHIFRNKNFTWAGTVIDKLQFDHEKHQPLYYDTMIRRIPIPPKHLHDATFMFNEFTRQTEDYLLRCENPWIAIYSNDKQWLHKIKTKVKEIRLEWYEPHSSILDTLVSEKNTIIVNDDFEYKYKITFNHGKTDKGLAKWLKSNYDRIKCSENLIKDIENGFSIKNRYIFLKSKKDIILLELVAGNRLLRIDTCVKKHIDK